MRTRAILVSAVAVAAPLASIAFASTAAHAATTTTTAVTTITNHLDSGYSGDNWATDTITRTASIAMVARDSTLTDCGDGATSCYTYKGTIKDTGTAAGINGNISPGADAVAIANSPTAAINGVGYFHFHSSSDTPDAGLVPTSITGNPAAPADTDDWVEQFFPTGTTFDPSGPNLVSWSWTYTDGKDCQTWLDASDVPNKADSGDITGADSCTTTIGEVPQQTVTIGTSYSFQVPGSTTSSDTSLTYTAAGLPLGLHIDSATGKITGTPATGADGGSAMITATDFGGVSASTEIGFTVKPASAPKVPVVSDGHATVDEGSATVTWKATGASEFEVTITGPGKDNGLKQKVTQPEVIYHNLELGHNYEVSIQPLIKGQPVGKAGSVTFHTVQH
jgi:hypothetical protein